MHITSIKPIRCKDIRSYLKLNIFILYIFLINSYHPIVLGWKIDNPTCEEAGSTLSSICDIVKSKQANVFAKCLVWCSFFFIVPLLVCYGCSPVTVSYVFLRFNFQQIFIATHQTHNSKLITWTRKYIAH